MLKQLDMPIYATPLTAAIIELKLEEHDLLYHTQIFTKKPGDKFKLGCFEVEFIHTNHSIADSVALAIKTPIGTVIHTGDFKIDLTPIQGGMIDLPASRPARQRGRARAAVGLHERGASRLLRLGSARDRLL